MKFKCSNCKRVLKVKDEMTGKKGKCPACGATVVVPTITPYSGGSTDSAVNLPDRFIESKRISIPTSEKVKKIKCPNCDKTIQAKDDLAGKKAKCPGCGQPLIIPMPAKKAESSTCPNCGSQMSSEALICNNCDFDTRSGKSVDYPESTKVKSLLICMKVVGYILIVAGWLTAIIINISAMTGGVSMFSIKYIVAISIAALLILGGKGLTTENSGDSSSNSSTNSQ